MEKNVGKDGGRQELMAIGIMVLRDHHGEDAGADSTGKTTKR